MALTELEKTVQHLKKEVAELGGYVSDSGPQGEDDETVKIDFNTCVVVDNLPKVGPDRKDKLVNVIRKVFSQVGKIEEDGIYMPMIDGQSGGFCFIDYATEDEAKLAVENIDGTNLDSRHKFRVTYYNDLEKYKDIPETYVAPEEKAFTAGPNPRSWLSDERDQFVLRYGSETEIFWCESGQAPEMEYGGEKEKDMGKIWCEQYVMWSPQGSYLATFHKQGVALWGGDGWEKLGRFAHPGVRMIEFSPEEKYMVTYSAFDDDKAAIVWDVAAQKPLRVFPASAVNNDGQFAPFKWSHDDQYLARSAKDAISIYVLPSMKILDKKSLKAEDVRDFFWSPRDNILAYWAPESPNSPARVSLVEIPSRKQIRQKNLFNVSDCKLHWQEDGQFLSVKVTRPSKSGKTNTTNFELFRVQENLVPVEMLEMKDRVVAFSWEPRGTRFAIVHGDGNMRFNVSFYDMCGKKGTETNELTHLFTLEDKACNHLYWSPLGGVIVLAGLGDMNGILEFYDVDNQSSFVEQEHFKCTGVEWDPSGRIVATTVAQPLEGGYYKYQMDNGYMLWTFQGSAFHREKKELCYQLLWRPRPASLLTPEQYKDVVRNLKKYEKKYLDADKKRDKERRRQARLERKRQRSRFGQLLRTRHKLYLQRKPQMVDLRDGRISDDEDDYIIESEMVDEVVSKKEEIVQ